MKVSVAATPDLPVLQVVLTLSARIRHSPDVGERQVYINDRLFDIQRLLVIS